MRRAVLVAIVSLVFVGEAYGADGIRGDVLTYGTALSVNNGFSDRTAIGVAANVYSTLSGWGVHFDAASNWREENASFFAGGLSYAVTPNIRPKVMLGTSSSNLGILPRTYVYGTVEVNVAPFIFRPAVFYREFRNGVEQTTPQLEAVYYFPAPPGAPYFVAQGSVGVDFVNPGSHIGYLINGALTYVMPKVGTLEMGVFGGTMAYDNVLCKGPCGVSNKFVGIRPKVSAYFGESSEVYLAGEFVRTDYYDVAGGSLGLKVGF